MRSFLMIMVAALAIAVATPARADTTLAVVDIQRVMNETEAGKSILAQLKTRRESLDKAIKALEAGLKKDEQALIEKRKTAKPDEFEKDRKAFEKKVGEGRAKAQQLRVSTDQSFNKAVQQLRDQMIQVISTMATEKKISLVITKQNVVIGDKSLEMTDDVMTRLNAKVKTIKVN